MKVTIALRDDELYRAVKVRAAQSGRQIRDIVEDALEMWLTAEEDAEDIRDAAEAQKEYDEVGGIDAEEYFRTMVAERRVEYGDG